MGKLRDAARDYWAAAVAMGGAFVAAYNIVDQLVKFGLVTNHRIWSIGLLTFLLFGMIAIIKFAANDRKYKSNLPNIVLEPPYVDERAVTIPGKEYPLVDSSRTGTPSAISQYQSVSKSVDRIEKYYFAHAVFTNKPPAGNAMNCIPEIEFYDEHMNRIPIYGFYGRFGQERAQPDSRDFAQTPKSQLRVDILANGDTYELDLAMKHKQENFCFAFNDESYSAIEYRRLDFKLSGNRIFICIHLRGENLKLPPFWFELLNEGKDGGMKIRKMSAPKR